MEEKQNIIGINKNSNLLPKTKVTVDKLAIILLTAIVGYVMLGCAPAKADGVVEDEKPTIEEVIPTPSPISTIKPTVTPTPTIKPTPTIMPELTTDQIKTLLGVYLATKTIGHNLGNVYEFVININKHDYRIYGYLVKGETSVTLEVYSVSCDEYLFSIDYSQGNKLSPNRYYENILNYNETLSALNPQAVKSVPLTSLAQFYKIWKIDYKNNETLNEFSQIMIDGTDSQINKLIKTFYLNEQLMDLFINSTPTEDMLPFWFYVPNTKMPEELNGYYSDITVSTPTATVSPASYKEKTDLNVTKGYKTMNYWNNRPKTMAVNSINKGGYIPSRGRSIA